MVTFSANPHFELTVTGQSSDYRLSYPPHTIKANTLHQDNVLKFAACKPPFLQQSALYKAARTEAQEYETVKQNVDALLTVPKEQEQQRRYELE